jgi:peptidoglycan-associated lipoprotein
MVVGAMNGLQGRCEMRRISRFLPIVLLVACALLAFGGCAKKPVAEPTAQPTDDTQALRGEDVALTQQPEETMYVEPGAGAFQDIHFEFDKYRITSDDEPVLQRIARWLKENEDVKVLIEGHCDERGTNEYNMALGEQRALAARRYMVGLGIDANRLNTISYGEEQPLDSASTEEAWAKNRRDHFTVSE